MFVATSLFALVNGAIVEELEAPAPVDCSGMSALFGPTIPKFGSDCTAWAELFAPGGKYYHAHAGFHTGANLESACTGYASFCPWTPAGNPRLNQPAKSACKFDISGAAQIVSMNGKCHALVPYIWAQDPANPANLEPHTGWEYMIAQKIKGSWKLKRFSEIETTFSVPFNWVTPNATDETWKLDALKTSQANKGECNNPIQPVLTAHFKSLSSTETKALYRQQGNAVALPAGGLCQLVVPYAAMVDGKNTEGKKVFTLSPTKGSYTIVSDVVTFTSYTQPDPAPTCQAANLGACNSMPCCEGMYSMSTLGGCFCRKCTPLMIKEGLMRGC